MTTQHAIDRPEEYLPGTGDNFVSDEVIVQGVTASRAWRFLVGTSTRESYRDNVAGISFPDGDGPGPADGVRCALGTFGLPPPAARVAEFRAPGGGAPGRLSWTALQAGGPDGRLDVPHAWLVEDLPGDRVRILAQESQSGKPAADPAGRTPNPMPNGHHAWLDGPVRAARGQVAG